MNGYWKPGDVGMLACRDGVERLAILTDRGNLAPLWIACAEDWGRLDEVPVRPVVVIDPEDAEQVERVGAICYDAIDSGADIQAALREFAVPTPPKPAEPQGLGAVVLCVYHNRYIHLGDGKWQHLSKHRGIAEWDELDAVRVLSEGWTP